MAVTTKLLVPERRSGLVARPGLIEALEAGRARRVTLVAAPTGFGKTSVLSEWAAESPARFAWVSLDAGDDDPSRFWSYVVAAIEGTAPELPGTAGRRLRGPGVSIDDEVLPVLVNELTTLAQPLVLVLDDYHVIEAEEIHAGVQYLLDRLGPRRPRRPLGVDRPAAAARPAAGARRAERVPRRHAALQRVGGRRAAQRRARPPARAGRARRAVPADRRLGGRAQPRRAVAARHRRPRRASWPGCRSTTASSSTTCGTRWSPGRRRTRATS